VKYTKKLLPILVCGLVLGVLFVPNFASASITVSGSFNIGGTVVVNLKAYPNPTTQSPISHFVVYVYYGVEGSMPADSTLFIIYDADYYANSDGEATVSFTVPNRNGQIVIKSNAIDEAGRAAIGEYYTFYVTGATSDSDNNSSDSPYPNNNQQTGTPNPTPNNDNEILLILVIIIGVALGVGVGAFYIVTKSKEMPPPQQYQPPSHCPRCGAPLTGTNFCASCGQRLV
jgi:ABC-type transport system involved in multi-copper enzyme maturation permease subunit